MSTARPRTLTLQEVTCHGDGRDGAAAARTVTVEFLDEAIEVPQLGTPLARVTAGTSVGRARHPVGLGSLPLTATTREVAGQPIALLDEYGEELGNVRQIWQRITPTIR